MNKRLLVVEEMVKAATSYGEAVYRYQRSVEEVQCQKSNLETLKRWVKEPGSDGRRKRWRREIKLVSEAKRMGALEWQHKLLVDRINQLFARKSFGNSLDFPLFGLFA